MNIKPIAVIHNKFRSKFGIPRQSGLAKCAKSKIIFEPEYRVNDAVRGLEEFTHLWLIWQFSETAEREWTPTVRPPRLGGNKRVGVFATRSPYRPNSLGLSSVRLDKIDFACPESPVIYVSGADLLDGTPIYDIKPYLKYADMHEDASDGFALSEDKSLKVEFAPGLLELIPKNEREAITELLAGDPRPGYQNDSSRVYGMTYGEINIKFKIKDGTAIVTEIKTED